MSGDLHVWQNYVALPLLSMKYCSSQYVYYLKRLMQI